MRLGKLAPKFDNRTLRLGKYLTATAPLPPAASSIAWQDLASRDGWQSLGNDEIGDCTMAAAGHMEEIWNPEQPPTRPQIVAAYSALTGYNPSNPLSDTGATCLDALNFWRNTGIAGQKISAYAAVSPQNHNEIMTALDLFGGLYIGIQLPLNAQMQTDWQVSDAGISTPGSWGGHCVNLCGYDPWWLTCISWGKIVRMSWAWLQKYCDEAYACLSGEWASGAKTAPSGFNFTALQADLESIGTGG